MLTDRTVSGAASEKPKAAQLCGLYRHNKKTGRP
jgi:hypothetical protein